MVDVFIRNVDERVYRQFKAKAAQEGVTLAEELKHSVEMVHEKKLGAAGWLTLPTVSLGKRGRHASRDVDKLVSEAVLHDYNRYKRSHR